MAWEKSLFVGCTHGDLVCPDAIKVFKNFAETWKPKHRVHLGDVWDFRGIRKGASDEERAEGLTKDLEAGMELLEWYKPQILTLGNHDDRIWQFANQTANGTTAELFQGLCRDVTNRLEKMKIAVTPWQVDKYAQLPMGGPKLIHGFKSSAHPAAAHFANWGECITAHVHRPDTHTGVHIDGGKAYCIGTMARIEKMTYANRYAAKMGWRNSFAYGMHCTKTGAWEAWHVVKQKDGTWLSPHGTL